MAVNWGLAKPINFADSLLEYRRQSNAAALEEQRLADNAVAAQRETIDRQRADVAYNRGEGLRTNAEAAQGQYYRGDAAGARQTAISGNNFGLVEGLDKLGRERLVQRNATIANAAFDLKGLPVEQRTAAYNARIPAMLAGGMSQQDIEAGRADLSDATLDQHIGAAQSLTDKIKRQQEVEDAQTKADNQVIAIPEGGAAIRGDGTLLGSRPGKDTIGTLSSTDANGNPVTELYRIPGSPAYGGGNGGGGSSAPRPAAGGRAAGPVDQATRDGWKSTLLEVIPGATVTSNLRSPQHNREVGGAKGSYHLTGQGFDIVPPPGMSMRRLAERLRRSGQPIVELINEGDHVHVAFAAPGGGQPSAAQSGGSRGGVEIVERRVGAPKVRAADPRADAKAVTGYRKEFNGLPEVKNFRVQQNAYNQVQSLARANAGAYDDLGLIFSVMKVFDPTSTVREGEFANAQNAAGVPDRIKNYFNMAANGTRLNAAQRQEIVGTVGRVFAQSRNQYRERLTEYRGYAAGEGLNPDSIGRLGGAGPGPVPQQAAAGQRAGIAPRGQVAGGGSIRTVSSPQEAASLPVGTRFRTPDGMVRVKR